MNFYIMSKDTILAKWHENNFILAFEPIFKWRFYLS